ncbi:MAG: hypothetical protein IKC94_04875 [Lentisphaeria bacterium]|nr:hypothetical protein [Lentisphaeria bacterium]
MASGIVMQVDVTGSDSAYLREVIRQLDRYARAAGVEHSRQRITIVPSRDETIRFSRNTLALPGNAGVWQDDFELRSKLYTFLIAHRFNLPYPGRSVKLFEWIVAGIDAELEAAATSGQHLVANREYFLLSGFAAVAGRVPDFAVMSKSGLSSDPVLRDFYGAQARILLTILAENGKIKELFRRNFQGAGAECFLEFYTSAENAAVELDSAAERLIWNRYRPIPAAVAMHRLAGMEKMFIQKADENGVLTGDFMECSWRELSAQLAAKRPDKHLIRNRFARQFTDLSRLCGDREKAACAAVTDAARQLDGSPENDEKFFNALNRLKATFARRQEIERFLTDTMLINAPLPDHFQRLFKAARVENYSCTADELRFLQQTVNDYLFR